MPRSSHKETSKQKILKAGAARLRQEGLSGAGINGVMRDAGLTHGAFYAHFKNKDEMLVAAFRQALEDNRPRWTGPEPDEAWPKRLERLAKRYLTPKHRDDLSTSCALAALLSDAARSDSDFNRVYEEELLNSVDAICGQNPCDASLDSQRFQEALMFFALCVGGISLSRAVEDQELSDLILNLSREAAGRIRVGGKNAADEPWQATNAIPVAKDQPLALNQYPFRSREKLRYADTDRQGHVNNAVFSTMLETGRVEILLNKEHPVICPDCSFVIASTKLDFLSEITWPGWADIGTRILKVSRSSITLEQAIFQNQVRAAQAQTVIVQINNQTKRSHPLSAESKQYLNSLAP